jgi:uncharacterized protein DUF6883
MTPKRQRPKRIPVPRSGVRLPHADRAVIDPRKLTDYALDPDKGDKARGFVVKLGIDKNDWRFLYEQIVDRVPTSDVVKITLNTWTNWPEFSVLIDIDGRAGKRAQVLTGWMVDDRQTPWLTTLHVI